MSGQVFSGRSRARAAAPSAEFVLVSVFSVVGVLAMALAVARAFV